MARWIAAGALALVAATLPDNSDLVEPRSGSQRLSPAAAADAARTGDLVVYDSDPSRYRNWRLIAQIHIVKTWTSRWDHIGLIVRGRAWDEEEKEPSGSEPASVDGPFEVCACADASCGCRPFVLEATAKGVQLFPFDSRVGSYRSSDVALRPLRFDRTEETARLLEEFVAEARGRPYNKHWWDLLTVWLRLPSERLKAARIERLEAALGGRPDAPSALHAAHRDYSLVPEARGCPRETLDRLKRSRVAGEGKVQPHALLCSELVALAYQRMGVLPPDWPLPTKYSPGDFMAARRVPLLPHARFEEPLGLQISPGRALAPAPAPLPELRL